MASEPTEGRALSVSLSPSLEEWLTERADEVGVEREELLVSLLGAYREATTGDTAETLLEPRAERIIERRLDQYDEDVERKLDDIRRRVVQVKQETDTKADAERVEEVVSRLDELESSVGRLRSAVDGSDSGDGEDIAALRESLRSRAETAVKLDERLDDVESKLTRVARVVVALREEHERDSAGDDEPASERDPVPTLAEGPAETLLDIKRRAAREELSSAECGACGESVDLSLLPEAACPHCGATFGGLEGRDGMFSSPRLVGEGGGADE